MAVRVFNEHRENFKVLKEDTTLLPKTVWLVKYKNKNIFKYIPGHSIT